MGLGKRPIEPRRQPSERVLRENIRFREEPEPANMRYRRCGIGHEKNDHQVLPSARAANVEEAPRSLDAGFTTFLQRLFVPRGKLLQPKEFGSNSLMS